MWDVWFHSQIVCLLLIRIFLKNFQEAIDLCVEAIEKAGYTGKIKIGMDVAASEFCKEGNKYDLDFKNADSKSEDWVSTDQLCEMYHGFIKDAPVVSIEDGFDQVIKKKIHE